jgi:mannose-1-phosphate guanylyltransferase
MIERLINTLPSEVEKVILAVSYMFPRIKQHFEKIDLGREVVLVEEKEPLGTGGAIKNVEKYIEDTFLVFNGDVVSSLDISSMIAFHKSKAGTGSISLWEVEDPTRYGIIGFDEEMKISRFLEKPKPEEVFSNWINAGVYVLEPKILDLMAPKKVISIEREVFPPLADKGKLYGFKFYGFWVDAGTPKAYLKAHRVLLDQEKPGIPNIHPKSKINPPILLGEDCIISPSSQLGPYACIGNKVKVLENTKVSNCVILGDVIIGKNNELEDCIIGYGSRIEDGFGSFKGLVLEDNKVLKKLE